MKDITKIAASILLLWLAISCSKEVNYNEPIVKIYTPELRQLFILPDTINVRFGVEHTKSIEYIKVSIVNNNMISISDQKFLHPENNVYDADINLALSALPESTDLPPYYINIAVSDFSEVNHTYMEIELANSELEYMGCFLIGKSGIDMLSISYFNDEFEKKYDTEISGNYSGSAISNTANMLYLITDTPDLARSLSCENGDLKWTKDPQLPYPEFNELFIDNNTAYISTAIGRIIGLSVTNGIQNYTTPVLPDSIPLNFCVTNDYLVSDIKLRNSDSKGWVTFYKQTGSRYQFFPTNYETVSMYGIKNHNSVVIFCNSNSTGHIITFDAETNVVTNNTTINNNKIHQSCKIDDNNFLFTSYNNIFHFNRIDKSYVKVYETDNNIIDIKFDYVNNKLFVVHTNDVQIISHHDLSNITTIESSHILRGVEILYNNSYFSKKK